VSHPAVELPPGVVEVLLGALGDDPADVELFVVGGPAVAPPEPQAAIEVSMTSTVRAREDETTRRRIYDLLWRNCATRLTAKIFSW